MPRVGICVQTQVTNDDLDLALQRHYAKRQFEVMQPRHSVRNIFLVRTISEFHADAVARAKRGELADATARIEALDAIAMTEDREILAAIAATRLPAMGFIRWRESKCDAAMDYMRGALQACATLAEEFDHDYLTAKRIHLAANLARVLTASDHEAGIAMIASLRRALDGDVSSWNFPGPSSLLVPLEGAVRYGLRLQLDRIASNGNASK